MTNHDTRTGSETAIPADVMEAARRAYETPIREDGSSLISIVNRMAEDDVKLAIARAIMAERERCALIAEEYGRDTQDDYPGETWISTCISAAIRLSTPTRETNP